MATEWRSREVEVGMPKTTLQAMWERARRSFDLTEGGRYDARSRTTMLLWSALLTAPGAEPVGSFTVRWDGPAEAEATIQSVAWAPRRGGSEAQVWRAIRVLAGAEWPVRWPAARRSPDPGRSSDQQGPLEVGATASVPAARRYLLFG